MVGAVDEDVVVHEVDAVDEEEDRDVVAGVERTRRSGSRSRNWVAW